MRGTWLRVVRPPWLVISVVSATVSLFLCSYYFPSRPNIPSKTNQETVKEWESSMTASYRYCYSENKSGIVFMHLSPEANHPLELCAFKSAAVRHPPDVGVCILSRYPMKMRHGFTDLPNVEIAPLNVKRIFKDTPLEEFYAGGGMTPSNDKYFIVHLSDALRYAYLYKYGGVYLDTDFLVLRRLDTLKNVLGWQDGSSLNGAILVFDKHHPLMEMALKLFSLIFRPGNWASAGPDLLTKLHKLNIVDNSTYQALNTSAFYAMPYWHYGMPFDPDQYAKVKEKLRESYTLHLFRQMWKFNNTFHTFISPPKGSFTHKFLHEVCLKNLGPSSNGTSTSKIESA